MDGKVSIAIVLSKKWREIDTLLLNATNRKYHIAYLFVLLTMTLENLEGRSPNAGLIQMLFDEHLCDIYQNRLFGMAAMHAAFTQLQYNPTRKTMSFVPSVVRASA